MFIHRGLIEKNFRENHITSLKECIKKKFNIETDIHFTQNNTPICFHDYSLRRLFNIRKKTRTILDKNLKKYNLLFDIFKDKKKKASISWSSIGEHAYKLLQPFVVLLDASF